MLKAGLREANDFECLTLHLYQPPPLRLTAAGANTAVDWNCISSVPGGVNLGHKGLEGVGVRIANALFGSRAPADVGVELLRLKARRLAGSGSMQQPQLFIRGLWALLANFL